MKALELKQIVFCTDFSEHSDVAFQMAKDLAWRYGARLHILHVMVSLTMNPLGELYVPVDIDTKLVEQATEAARETIQQRYLDKLKAKQDYAVHILSGYPATEIKSFAESHKVDLIIMGSHGLTGLAHVLFGSTADRVVRKAPCSVLTVRLPGPRSAEEAS